MDVNYAWQDTYRWLQALLDRMAADWPQACRILLDVVRRPAEALDRTLDAIARQYGERTSNVVAMQLEYFQRSRAS